MRQCCQLILLCNLLLLSSLGLAAEVQPRRSLSVDGQAERLVSPDQAELSMTVQGRGPDAQAAMQRAGTQAAAVLKTLRGFIAANQIRATHTQVRSVVQGTERTWRQDGSEAMEMLASRDIVAQRIPVEQLPALMTALAGHALARVNQLALSVANASEIEAELSLLAIDDAKRRAQRIAQRLGVGLGLPITVELQRHSSPQPEFAGRAMTMKAAAAGGGYEATGQDRISARVHIVFELTAPSP